MVNGRLQRMMNLAFQNESWIRMWMSLKIRWISDFQKIVGIRQHSDLKFITSLTITIVMVVVRRRWASAGSWCYGACRPRRRLHRWVWQDVRHRPHCDPRGDGAGSRDHREGRDTRQTERPLQRLGSRKPSLRSCTYIVSLFFSVPELLPSSFLSVGLPFCRHLRNGYDSCVMFCASSKDMSVIINIDVSLFTSCS